MGGICCTNKDQKKVEKQNEIVTNVSPNDESNQTKNNIAAVIPQVKENEQLQVKAENIIEERASPIIGSKTNQKNSDEMDYLMLLGAAGVGKTTLFRQMQLSNIPNEKMPSISNYHEGNLDQDTIIIDTPSFQLDDDIEIRENFIKEFQSYFENRKQISSFGIVVNFERTDLMKKKVLQVLKYVRKFIKIISIIVVNMELSENEEEDKQHLRNSFKYMGYHQIIFINKNMNQKQIIQEIKQIKFKKQQIDFTDTIFEKITSSQEQIQMQQLQKALGERLNQRL